MRYRKPTPRTIIVRFAGNCACCGSPIKVGETATYYPAGTIANFPKGAIAHVGGLEGNSARCSAEIARRRPENDFAGDGLDERYEDECRDRCGL